MKQVDLNPLQMELARGQQAGPHPDADLLTGFAEGSLLEREREEMFAHLAGCAECRELLNVAMGAAASPVGELKPFLLARRGRSPMKAWIPWASVAAGIVLVCTAGLVYRERLEMKEQGGTESAAETSMAGQPAAPADSGLTGSSAAKPNAGKLKSEEPAQDANEMTPTAEGTTDEAKQTDASDQNSQSETASAGAAGDKAVAQTPAPTQIQAQARPQPQVQAPGLTQFESQPEAVAELQTAPAFAARKPARAMSKTSLAAAAPARPNWRINSSGAVERTSGLGVWQRVLTDEKAKMRVVSVSNAEVWVGGENARLYHSADGGETWKAVTLPLKNGRDHAIAHISFQTQQIGVVQADDGTSWSTADGGASWE